MASRAIQNSLRFLSSPSPAFQISLKPQTMRTHRSPSSGGGALYCTCRSVDDPFALTTPLYYVNAPPHMGSAYTTVAADAIARFQRLLGKKVIFITGTDEHGEKIASAAAASGSIPIEHCDSISQAYKALWREDILWFHAVYWRSMLMSAGLSLPKKVFGHGFFTKVEKAQQHYENLELSTACETVLEIGNAGNVYIDEKAPWSLFKQGGAAFETAAKLACPTSALVRTSFSFLRKFSTTESAGEAAGASANKPKRKKKKNFFEVAQFLPNWGIGYHMAKTHWTGVSYQITKINLYKDGRHGKAWGIAHKAGIPTTYAPKKISGVHKRGWRYIANSNKTEESTSKSELQTA